MDKARRLLGQAPDNKFTVRTDTGEQAEPGRTIFPIVSQHKDGTFIPIGTGFFIDTHGLFVTAAHVVEAVLDNGKPTGPFGLFQFLPDNHYIVRPILHATRHATSDVAVGIAAQINNNHTGEPFRNKAMVIAAEPPPIDSGVVTYAYPKSSVKPGTPQELRFQAGYHDGRLVEYLPHGRDKTLLPGPCFRTTCVIHSGASGGPVVGPDGTVFAINSTGLEDDSVSYVSCISEVLKLTIKGIQIPGRTDSEPLTVEELIGRGYVTRR